MDDLVLRAARHAALADVSRLRVVDLLAVGDASPRELQGELGMTSNLLAHHLGVLERVGLVARRRSEADRRRSYVSLVAAALPAGVATPALWRVAGATGSTGAEGAEGIVFVCTANSARSQLAAALWNARPGTRPRATSAGTHPADSIAERAVAAAGRRGMRLVGRPTELDVGSIGSSVVVTVCDRAHEELVRHEARLGTAVHWSVPDPVRIDTDEAFEATLDELETRIDLATAAS